MTLNKQRVVAAVLVLLVVASGAAAYTTFFTAESGVTYEADNGLIVTANTDHGLDDANPFNSSDTLYVGGVEISATSAASVTVDQFRGDRTQLSSIDTAGGTLTVDPDDKSAVDIAGAVTALAWEDAAIAGRNQMTYSASGTGTITATGLEADTDWTVATPSGELVDSGTTTSSGEAAIDVDAGTDVELILFTNHAPNASNFSPSDGTQLSESTVNFTTDISDHELGMVQGDEVEAELVVNNETVGSTNVTSNQTVSFTQEFTEGGSIDYYWVLSDSYGETTTTDTRTITTPSMLYVRNVTAPDELVSSGTATVTFYGGENEETIVEREVTNGTASMDNLPIDQEFTAVVEAEGYHSRPVVIQSLYDQSDVYLLPKQNASGDIVEVNFRLDDKTGRFSGEDTQLIVQRPISLNNSTNWENVVADDISASSELSTLLVNQQRYRLIVRNNEEARSLGAYTPSGPADPEIIPIGEIQIGGDAEANGTLFGATIGPGDNTTDSTQYIRMRYNDPSEATEEFSVTITNESGTVLYDATTAGPFGEFTDTVPVNASQGELLNVSYTAVRDGEPDASGEVTLGQPSCTWCVDMDRRLVNILSAISIVAVIGLVAPQDGALAGAAGLLWAIALVIGFNIPIPGPAIGLATGYATIFIVGRGGGG